MKITERLALMREIERRNNKRWSITTEDHKVKQTAIEYSFMESMMSLYVG